jgi:hypothetical protein
MMTMAPTVFTVLPDVVSDRSVPDDRACASRSLSIAMVFAVVCLCLCQSLYAQPGLIRWEPEARRGGTVKAPVELDDGVLLGAYTNPVGGGTGILCMRSEDGGRTWQRLSIIAKDPDRTTDIGDGDFTLLSNGHVLHSYRQNHYRGREAPQFEYAIKVAISKDRGKSWEHHSTVMTSRGENAGLWASFIMETESGQVQCYYDDEATPKAAGFERHQWAQMKTWNANASKWVNPVTVSRARNRGHLSRDGMCSVVELPEGRLICALESVTTKEPTTAVIRLVVSNDSGKTWSWVNTERFVLYKPQDKYYNAIAPWITLLSDGSLICVFETDEDMPVPNDVSTGKRNEDLKYVTSTDGGRSWSTRAILLDKAPIYLPGVLQLKHGQDAGTVLCCYVNTRTGALFTKRGQLVSEPEKSPSELGEDNALAFAEIELRNACGNGREVYLKNTGTRTLVARVSKHWTDGDEQKTLTATIVVRVGDKYAKRLGCSVRRISGGSSRVFEWVVDSASFR